MNINIANLIGSIKAWDTWVVILVIVIIVGMLGGLAHKLTSPPTEQEKPWWNYLVVGTGASIAVLFISVPTDILRLIAQSLVAGYAGKAILNAMEARVTIAVAKENTKRIKASLKKAVNDGKKAVGYATDQALKLPAGEEKDQAMGKISELSKELDISDKSSED